MLYISAIGRDVVVVVRFIRLGVAGVGSAYLGSRAVVLQLGLALSIGEGRVQSVESVLRPGMLRRCNTLRFAGGVDRLRV
jgi:hypothetical protein